MRMPATSEPPSGSVMASAPMSRPSIVGRTQRSICSASPAATRCGSDMPEVNSEAKQALDDEVHGSQVGQDVPLHVQRPRLGQQLLEPWDVQQLHEPGEAVVAPRPEPDVGGATLVTASGARNAAERGADGVAGRWWRG